MSLMIETLQRIDLGIQGEHNATVVRIDCNAWLQQYPNGVISLYHKRHGDEVYGVTGANLNRQTGILTWTATEQDTYYGGDGMAEIRLTESSVLKKKKKAITLVRPAVVNENEETVSSNMQAYIDEVERMKSELGSQSEAWAIGKRNGIDVSSDDETYHNNSKYYADTLAEQTAEYIAEIEAAGAAAEALIPEDLTFYASVTSVTNRLADYAYVEGTTLVLGEPDEEEEDDD